MTSFVFLPDSPFATAAFKEALADHEMRSRFFVQQSDVILTILFQNDKYRLEGINPHSGRYPIVLRSLSTGKLIGVTDDVVTLIRAARVGYDLRISA